MNIYLITQKHNNGWDTFDSAVVLAKTKAEAILTHPDEYKKDWDGTDDEYGAWVEAALVTCYKIGVADDGLSAQVLCSSFNAG